MFQFLDRLGLRWALNAVIGATLTFSVALTATVVNAVVQHELELGWRERAEEDARRVAGWVAAPLAAGSDELVAAVVDGSLHAGGDAYLVVVRASGRVAARSVRPGYAGSVEIALAARARGPGVTWVTAQGVYALRLPVRDAGGQLVGHVVYGQDAGELSAQVRRVQLVILALLVGGALLVCGTLWWLIDRLVIRRLRHMSQVALRVSEYDLTARAEAGAQDELGQLATSLNRIGENLAATLSRVRDVVQSVQRVIERASATGVQVAGGAATVSARVAETSASMRRMLDSLKDIAAHAEVLARSADASSSSIEEMAATNGAVAESIRTLATSVNATTSAIEQMTRSMQEVAHDAEQLSATAGETSSSMNEMDASITQVGTNANATARLSEQATRDAELGTGSLARTLSGIERIKASSGEAAAVIESLGGKVEEIGKILSVIDEVAEQTNLLALNAAILAAQSGEHGRGFAVVADEIKDLAERTASSTKEIAELIRSVQQESTAAVAAMHRGVQNVEEGVRLGAETDDALKKIQASSQKSTQMVTAIARATVEQARGSRHVTTAIQRIAETVMHIARATSEQARGSEQIMRSAEEMRMVTQHVERSSHEQAAGSAQITRAIVSVTDMVQQLNRAQREQTRGSEQVLGAVEQIRSVAEAQTVSVTELEGSIAELARQADVLRSEVARFKT